MPARRFATVAILLAGLLAIVAIAAGSPRPLALHSGTDHVGPAFVDYAFTGLTVLFVVAMAFAVYTLWRFRGEDDDDSEPAPWWTSYVWLALAFALVGMLRLLHVRPASVAGMAVHGDHARGAHALPPDKIPPDARNAHFEWKFAIALAVVLGIAAAVVARRRRSSGELAAPLEPELEPSAAVGVATALDESLDDLRRERDVRRAVIAAYARMERALAAAGLPRRPAEAPFEYLERALRALAAGAPSIRRLTELFERAKFSHHPLGSDAKDEAIAALTAVRDEVRAAT
jgi:hypothetical protein